MVTDKKGEKCLMLFELQTKWHKHVPLNLMDYRARYLMKYGVNTFSYVMLLKPSGSAVNIYEDNEIRFIYNLIKVYELDARDILDQGLLCLMPFVPVMKYGKESLNQADDMICKSEKSRSEKADMLTSMAILSGVISKDMPVQLINRRKDIMIESAAYEIIKQDGIQEGLEKGLQQGLPQGLQEGKISEAREMLLEVLKSRFGAVPDDLVDAIDQIVNREKLKSLVRLAVSCENVEVIRKSF